MSSMWMYTFAYALPELFALGVALALLMNHARAGAGRRLGMIGIATMLAASVVGLTISVLQNLLLSNTNNGGSNTDLHSMMSAISALRMLVNLASLGGLLTVVWGLCRATREPPAT